jgi:hypothetical protein
MPVETRLAAVHAHRLIAREPIPLVRGWNRLEGRPRSADLERSLRAEVRDPLWFLTRQWQFGEFAGEDAGSPVEAIASVETVALDGLAIGQSALAYDPSVPLEARIEREPAPFDLPLHIEASDILEQLLQDAGLAPRLADFAAAWPLGSTGVKGVWTSDAEAMLDLGQAFLIDASALLAGLIDGSYAAKVSGFSGITPLEKSDLIDVGALWQTWFEGAYPGGLESEAWQPDRLSYGFSCRAPGVRLRADHYAGGSLDWSGFDLEAVPDEPGSSAEPLAFLPAMISFAGMPNPRYWEMESARTEFGRMDVNTNDVARLLLTEFMLLYSNDWCMLPLELDIGSFTRVAGILVSDVFGEQTLVRPANSGPDSVLRWSMYRLTGDDGPAPGLLLAPALTTMLEGPKLEEVHFLRDEMANLVWAVEHRSPSALGEPFDPAAEGDSETEFPSGPDAHYVLGSSVPSNWRPFVPARVPGTTRSIRLQRARLPGTGRPLRGDILNIPAPYFVNEEEVPRAGRIVDRRFQRARWLGGSAFLWVGRTSVSGRGEGSSGLVFDHVDEGMQD